MTNTTFEFKDISGLVTGLDVSKPSSEIPDTSSPDLLNVYPYKGEIRSDTGYTTFGSTITGYPQLCVQLFYKSGTSDLILITTSRCYIWRSSDWRLVAGDTYTTLSSAASATDTTIDVVDDTGFSDGDNIVVNLDSGEQHVTTVNGAPSTNTITLTDAMPSSAAAGKGVFEYAVLNGNIEDQVNFTQWTAGDILIITNNNDNVKQFDGTQLTDVSNLPNNNVQARDVAIFNNYLLLLSTTEDGTEYPQRIRWCDTADITNWSSGEASYEDLYDVEDYIMCGKPLGPHMYIYRERSIYRCTYIGSSDLLFEFEGMVSGEGVVSSQAVADPGGFHIFFGNANVYRYDGDFGIEPMADPIYYKIFGTNGMINPGYLTRVFGLYVEELDEIWFFFPSTGSEVPDTLLRYSNAYDALFLRQYAHSILGYGFYTATNARTWSELVGSWNEQDWTWNSRRLLASSPTTLLCGYDPKQVYEYDYVAQDDAGTDISWYFETKDFATPSSYMRLDMLEFEGKGPTINVDYSTDYGGTWSNIFNDTVGTSYTKHRIWKQAVSDKIRFKFSGSSGGFALRRLRMKYKEESTW